MREVLFALAVLTASGVAAGSQPAAQLDSATTWHTGNKSLGGFSGLHLTPDGARFVAISDKGTFATGRLDRQDGQIVGVSEVTSGPLLSTKGEALDAQNVDAEGLAIAPDGTTYVSFESNDRIAVSAGIGLTPSELLKRQEFTRLQDNSALEAIALAPDGTLIAIPERSGRLERPFPVFRWKDGEEVETWALERIGEYLVTDATFDQQGRLYVLERRFEWGQLGFSTRVRRFQPDADGPGTGEILLQTPFGTHGNLEGISVWQDDTGQYRMTLISDDNFSHFLSTQFVEYILAD